MTFFLPVDDILSFWFGDATRGVEELQRQAPLWYAGGASIDAQINARFGSLFELAAAYYGAADSRIPGDCRECLAAILLFDQFSRNCFRKTARAFAFDHLALTLMDCALQQKWDEYLHPLECIFLYMPLQHAESLPRQQQGVALFDTLLQRTPKAFHDPVAGSLRFAHLHLDVIARFGRFPHRNDVLQRATTSAEQAYLAEGSRRFGQ